MNITSIIGNLARNPDVSYKPSDNPLCICRLTVAVNDGYGDKQTTSFIPVTVFGRQAENCERFLHKGSKVAISGRIQTGNYEKDGRKVYTTDVIADKVEFLGNNDNWQMP